MSMNLFVIGLNHKTASVELRERVAFGQANLGETLGNLCAADSIYGAVILSTCNRTEVYAHAATLDAARNGVCSMLEAEKGIVPAEILPHLYTLAGSEAARHLFNVVSSLDSMVLGEAQIAGQVKDAFKIAQNASTTTMLLDRVFRQAREVGKRVRNQTSIGDSHVSLSTVAVDVAIDKFGDLTPCTTLIVGSGKMSELAARYLQEQGAKSLLVASRTHAHARSVAKRVGGEAHYFEELGELVLEADIIISSTAAPHYIIAPEALAGRTKPLLILDLAMPRDVDPACADIDGVSVCDLDDLGTIVAMNQRNREEQAQGAHAIVEEELGLLEDWVAQHAVTPTIKQLRAQAEDVRRDEVKHLLRVMQADLSDDDVAAIEAATNALVKKMLHAPTVALKDSVRDHTDYEMVDATRTLFGLADESEGAPEATIDQKAPALERQDA